MSISEDRKQHVKRLAIAITRPGSVYRTGYWNKSEANPERFFGIDAAIADGREFMSYAANHLYVLDIDLEQFKSPESMNKKVDFLKDSLLARNLKFLLVDSGTGFHLFINLWSVPVEPNDISKVGALNPAVDWINKLIENIDLDNFKVSKSRRINRPIRLPLSPHKNGLNTFLIYPSEIDIAESHLRYGGVLGRGVKLLSKNAEDLINAKILNQKQNRSKGELSLALSLANYGYTYEDYVWVLIHSKSPIYYLTQERKNQRNRLDEVIKQELERNWKKAIDRVQTFPAESDTRREISLWWHYCLHQIGKLKINTKTKIGLLVYITEIAVVAHRGNTLEPTISQSRLAIDSQLGDSTIQRYNQMVPVKRLLTISQGRGRLFDSMATTVYKLSVPNLKDALIPNDLKKVLKPKYLTIKNGDVSAFTTPNTSGRNNYCHIDLGVISGIWHPHDNWYNSKVSAGLAGKLIWNLAQGLLYGRLEDLCDWLDPEGGYFRKTTLERLRRVGLVSQLDGDYFGMAMART